MSSKSRRARGRALHRANSLATRAFRHIAAVTWTAIGLTFVAHYAISWFAMHLVSEIEIASGWQFWYFYLVTAATVGYGDLTAHTIAGRAIAVFWIMPGGIVIFSSIVGKLVQSTAGNWRRRMLGLSDYSDLEGHTVILGWQGERTRRMVTFLRRDQPHREVVLAAHSVAENPLPDAAHFVHGDSLTEAGLLARAGIQTAGRVIVLGNEDNETLAASLAAAGLNRSVHLIAFFNDEQIADLLKAHCPHAECMAPMATELLARAADDPGASRVPKILLSTLVSPTLYSLRVPEEGSGASFSSLFFAFYRRHHATLLGVASGRLPDEIFLNPPGEHIVMGGETLYYIAEHRLAVDSIHWAGIALGND